MRADQANLRSAPLYRGVSPLLFTLSLTLSTCTFLLTEPPCAQELFELPATATATATGPAEAQAQSEPQGLYKLLPLLSQYRGEERRGVRYFTPAERAQHKVTVKGGRLWDANGQALNPDVRRPKMTPIHAPVPPPPPAEAKAQGYAIYVIDREGQLYVSFESEKDRVHHSSLLAGGAVACAGELLVFQGELLLLNNQSGHYRPPPAALRQAVDALTRAGLDLSKVKVKTFGVDL